jgi:uncharacterized protein YqhQ
LPDQPRYVGGQAVIDGVMMRGENSWAVAVRTPDGGVDVKLEDAPRWGQSWGRIPFVRGVVALAEAMTLGYRALSWAADKSTASPDDEGEPEAPSKLATGLGVVLGLAFFAGVFIVLPAVIARVTGGHRSSAIATNGLEGAIRLALFIGYLAVLGRVPDIRRLFEYHGAEHKAIAAYERGVEVTPEHAQTFTTEHVRCGTNFTLLVLVLAVVAHTFFGRPSWPVLIGSRLLIIPVVAGVAYEAIRLAANHLDNRVVRVLMVPGLALQRLTTREPSLDQIEVAITALRAVLTAEQRAEVDARTPATAPVVRPRLALS